MKVTILASGSGGNVCLFEAGGTRIMVDAGVAPRTLARKLDDAGIGAPDAIVVTHAHSDHVGHAGPLSRKWNVPVYVTESTARFVGDRVGRAMRVYGAREPFAIGALTVAPLPLPHDAAQVALVVSDGARRAAIVTDLGEVPPGLPGHIAACDVLLVESNHDPWMLEHGPYRRALKRRIASARGHLSNQQTHALLRALPDRAQAVVLMHLSQTNNRPDLALDVARDALSGRRAWLHAAAQDECLVIDAGAARPREPIGSGSAAGDEPAASGEGAAASGEGAAGGKTARGAHAKRMRAAQLSLPF